MENYCGHTWIFTVEGNSKAIKSISMQMGFLCEEIIGLLSIKVSSENNNHGRQAGKPIGEASFTVQPWGGWRHTCRLQLQTSRSDLAYFCCSSSTTRFGLTADLQALPASVRSRNGEGEIEGPHFRTS